MDEQYLYRLTGGDESLLYIGISDDWSRRMREHWLTKPWATEIRGVRLETHRGRVSVEAAERAAIRTEHPRYNIQHNGPSAPALPQGRQLTAGEVIALTALAIFAAWVLYEVGTAAYERYRTWRADRSAFLAWKASCDGETVTATVVTEPIAEPVTEPAKESVTQPVMEMVIDPPKMPIIETAGMPVTERATEPVIAVVPVPGAKPVPAPVLPTGSRAWLTAACIAYLASRPSITGLSQLPGADLSKHSPAQAEDEN